MRPFPGQCGGHFLSALLLAALVSAQEPTSDPTPTPTPSGASQSQTGSRTALPTASASPSTTPSQSPTAASTSSPSASPACGVGLTPATPAVSCLDAWATCGLTNTTVWLRPASNATAGAYLARCAYDGWVLAMKLDGTSPLLGYYSSYWTDNRTLNDDARLVDVVTEAKYVPFLDQPGSALRLVFTTPDGRTGAPVDAAVGAFGSLAQLFANDVYRPTSVLRPPAAGGWNGALVGGIPYQGGCNAQGVNVRLAPSGGWGVPMDRRMRLGIYFNNEREWGRRAEARAARGRAASQPRRTPRHGALSRHRQTPLPTRRLQSTARLLTCRSASAGCRLARGRGGRRRFTRTARLWDACAATAFRAR
jgi:hypothetical protein